MRYDAIIAPKTQAGFKTHSDKGISITSVREPVPKAALESEFRLLVNTGKKCDFSIIWRNYVIYLGSLWMKTW